MRSIKDFSWLAALSFSIFHTFLIHNIYYAQLRGGFWSSLPMVLLQQVSEWVSKVNRKPPRQHDTHVPCVRSLRYGMLFVARAASTAHFLFLFSSPQCSIAVCSALIAPNHALLIHALPWRHCLDFNTFVLSALIRITHWSHLAWLYSTRLYTYFNLSLWDSP